MKAVTTSATICVAFILFANSFRSITHPRPQLQAWNRQIFFSETKPYVSQIRDKMSTKHMVSALLVIFVDIFHILHKSLLQPLTATLEILRLKPLLNLDKYYKGKTVWITGASSGIGEALANALSSHGANVIISARNESKLEAVAINCRQYSTTGSKVIILPLDLENYTTFSDVCIKAEELLKKEGLENCIDILINNAGISSRGAAIHTDVAVLEKIMATNFYGPVELTRVVLPQMLARHQGAIAVISSVQGKIGLPYRTSYSASKHAVQGYFDGLRAELADQGVNVTVVSPGYVATSLSLNALNSDGSTYGRMDETTANGLNPTKVAEEVLLGIAKGSADVIIADTKTSLAIQIRTLFPEFMARYLRKW
eukprot:gene1583-3059_t